MRGTRSPVQEAGAAGDGRVGAHSRPAVWGQVALGGGARNQPGEKWVCWGPGGAGGGGALGKVKGSRGQVGAQTVQTGRPSAEGCCAGGTQEHRVRGTI